jgi:hypothetical protein
MYLSLQRDFLPLLCSDESSFDCWSGGFGTRWVFDVSCVGVCALVVAVCVIFCNIASNDANLLWLLAVLGLLFVSALAMVLEDIFDICLLLLVPIKIASNRLILIKMNKWFSILIFQLLMC